MAQRMGRYLSFQPGTADRAPKANCNRLDRLVVPLDKMRFGNLLIGPAPHVAQQLRGQGNRRLPLLGRLGTLRKPVEQPSFEIDVRSAFRSIGRCSSDGSGAGSRIERDKDKPSDVL